MTDPFRLRLAAFPDSVPVSEARVYWNCKDDPTPVLDAALRKADYFSLGSWAEQHESDEPQSAKCPALRVSDWLFFRGTIDSYAVPVLDDRLVSEILGVFEARSEDLPAEVAPLSDLQRFLVGHLGCGVVVRPDPASDY